MTSSDTSTFAKNLKALRKKAGLTQEELAHRIGVSVMTIRRWEWEDSKPDIEGVKKLAEALHVKEQQLLSPEMPPRWVLTVKIAQDLSEEVIDMTKEIPTVSKIVIDHDGAHLFLGGSYKLWADDDVFNQILEDMKKSRFQVIQNGKFFGALPA